MEQPKQLMEYVTRVCLYTGAWGAERGGKACLGGCEEQEQNYLYRAKGLLGTGKRGGEEECPTGKRVR